MSIGTYGLIGSRAAQIYGREDTAGERTSDRIQARIDDRINRRLASARGGIVDRPALPPPPAAMPAPPPAPMPGPSDQQLLQEGSGFANKALNVAGGLGAVMDVPGSFFRDLVTLLPGGPAPANPFDQLAPWNWASMDNRTSEEEILEGYGLYDDGPSENRGALTNIGRFVGELGLGIALDPLTYLSGGLTAAARASKAAGAAKKAGLFTDNILGQGVGNERLIKAAKEKLGPKAPKDLGKREAATYASVDDLRKTTLDVDSATPAAKRGVDARYEEGLRQTIKSEADRVAAQKSSGKALLSDGYFRIDLPFGMYSKSFFKGDKAQALARTMDKAGEAVRFGKYSPVKPLAPVFNKSLRGSPRTVAAQKAALQQADRLVEAEATSREVVFDAARDFERLDFLNPQKVGQETANKYSDAMIEYMEDIGRPRAEAPLLDARGDAILDVEGNPRTIMKATEDSLGQWKADKIASDQTYKDLNDAGVLDRLDVLKDELAKSLDNAQANGIDITQLDDKYASYLTRVSRMKDVSSPGKRVRGRRANDPSTEFAQGRLPHRKNIVGGTAMLNRMSRDGRFAGMKEVLTKDNLKSERNSLFEQFISEDPSIGYGNVIADLSDKQKNDLFNELFDRSRKEVKAGFGLYQSDVADSVLKGISASNAAIARNQGLRKFLADQAVLRQPDELDQLMKSASDAFGEKPSLYRIISNAARNLLGDDIGRGARQVEVRRVDPDGTNPSMRKDLNDPPPTTSGGDPPSGGKPGDGGTPPPDGGGGPSGGGTPPKPSKPTGGRGKSKDKPDKPSKSSSSNVDQVMDELEAAFDESLDDEAVKDAQALVKKVDSSGKAPVNITKNIRRIAKGVGVSIEKTDKGGSVYEKIKAAVADAPAKPDAPAKQTAKKAAKKPAEPAGVVDKPSPRKASESAAQKAASLLSDENFGIVDKPASPPKKQAAKKVEAPATEVVSEPEEVIEEVEVTAPVELFDEIPTEPIPFVAKHKTQVKSELKGKRRALLGSDVDRFVKSYLTGGLEDAQITANLRKFAVGLGVKIDEGESYQSVINKVIYTRDQDFIDSKNVSIAKGKKVNRAKNIRVIFSRRHGINIDASRASWSGSQLIGELSFRAKNGDEAFFAENVERAKQILSVPADGELPEFAARTVDVLSSGTDEQRELADKIMEIHKVLRGTVSESKKASKRATSPRKAAAPRKAKPEPPVDEMNPDDAANKSAAQAAKEMEEFFSGDTSTQAKATAATKPATATKTTKKPTKKRKSRSGRKGGQDNEVDLSEGMRLVREQEAAERKLKVSERAAGEGGRYKRNPGSEYAVVATNAGNYHNQANAAIKEEPVSARIAESIAKEETEASLVHFGASSFKDGNAFVNALESLLTKYYARKDFQSLDKGQRLSFEKMFGLPDAEVKPNKAGEIINEAKENTLKEIERLRQKMSKRGSESLNKDELNKWVKKRIWKLSKEASPYVTSGSTKSLLRKWFENGKIDFESRKMINLMKRAHAEGLPLNHYVDQKSTDFVRLVYQNKDILLYWKGGVGGNWGKKLSNWGKKKPHPEMPDEIPGNVGDKLDNEGLFDGLPDELPENMMSKAEREALAEAAAKRASKNDEVADAAVSGSFRNDAGEEVSFEQAMTTKANNPEAFENALKVAGQEDIQDELTEQVASLWGTGFDGMLRNTLAFIRQNADSTDPSIQNQVLERLESLDKIKSQAELAKATAENTGKQTKHSQFARGRAHHVRGGDRAGVASDSSVSRVIDRVSEGYDPILDSASQDLGALIDDSRLPFETLQDVLTSGRDSLVPMLAAVERNGGLEDLMAAAREHDTVVRDLTGSLLPGGVDEYDRIMSEASQIAESTGWYAAGDVVAQSIPLMDMDGKLLGSRYARDYAKPELVAELAERLVDGSYLREHGYSNLGRLIEDKPQVFSEMVDAVATKADNGVQSGLKYGSEVDLRTRFYDQLEGIARESTQVEMPFISRTRAFLGSVAEDTVVSEDIISGRGLGLRPDEIEDLNLPAFFASPGQKTAGQLSAYIEANMPRVEVVNLDNTRKVPYSGAMASGGDGTKTFEIVIKRGAAAADGPDVSSVNNRYGTANLIEVDSRSAAQPVLAHLRGNVYTDSRGRSIMRITSDGESYRELVESGATDAASLESHRRAMMSGVKAALDSAARKGLDGIAIGRNVADSLPESQRFIDESTDMLISDFSDHIRRIGGGEGYTDFVGPESISPSRIKLHPVGEKSWFAGHTQEGKPVMINWSHNDKGYVVVEDKLLVSEGNVYNTISEAKEAAARAMNKPSQRGGNDVLAFEIDDAVRQYASDGQSLYKKVDDQELARIEFPAGEDPERWIESNFKTIITAFDGADPYSFAHEMGHLFRHYLRMADPDLLKQAEEIFSVRNGQWSGDGAFKVPNPVTGIDDSPEELFADMFMKWVELGGRQADQGADGFFTKARDFIYGLYRRFVPGSTIEDEMPLEMKKFFDDVFGGVEYSDYTNNNVKAVLDSLKYSSPVALSNVIEDFSPDTIKAANDLALTLKAREARESAIANAVKSSGVTRDQADAAIPTENLWVDAMNDAIANGVEDDVVKFTVPGGSKEYTVSMPSDRDILEQLRLPDEIASDILRYENLAKTISSETAEWEAWIDAMTNIFKSSVTAPFPGYHVRNLLSGAVQNALNDVYDATVPGFKKYTAPYMKASKVIFGDSIDDIQEIAYFKEFADADEATDELRKLAFMYGVTDSPGQLRDIYGVGGRVGDSIAGAAATEGDTFLGRSANFVRDRAADPYEVAGQEVGLLDRLNPLKVAGGGSSVDRFVGARYGRPIGDLVESHHRLSAFIGYISQGYDPAEAAKRAKMIHVDYGDLTGAERKVLRRIFPFYSFSKGMAKYLANEIYTRPGGPVGQSIRAANISKDQDISTPQYVSQGVSIPLGQGSDGSRNLLTGLGLMHESAVQQFDPIAKLDVRGGLFEAGKMLNPIPKGIIEIGTNRSLFQETPQGGRSLDDMDPLLGRTLTNIGNLTGVTDRDDPVPTPKLLESVLSNSPAARLLSTTRQITDERKGIPSRIANALTGLKITTVSPAAQDAVLRERASMLMRELGGRSFERSYIPDDVKAGLSPEDLEKAEMYESIMNLLAERAKQRKAIREMQEAQNN